MDPLQDHRDSGYLDKAAQDRAQRRKDLGITQGGGYA
jgi:hypothetical protein